MDNEKYIEFIRNYFLGNNQNLEKSNIIKPNSKIILIEPKMKNNNLNLINKFLISIGFGFIFLSSILIIGQLISYSINPLILVLRWFLVALPGIFLITLNLRGR